MVDLELAKEKISKKMYSEALESLTELRNKFPDDENIIFHLAECYFYLGQYAEALDILRSAKQNKNFDVSEFIDDLNRKIKEECKKLNAAGNYEYAAQILDKYCSFIDCRGIAEDLCDSIVKSMEEYNFHGQYDNASVLYNKYHGRFSNDAFFSNKMLNAYELAAHKIVLESKPRSIMLILTNSCDLDCIMCYQDKKTVKNIDKKVVDIVLDNLQYLEKIVWQGGEVLILPYFREILLKTIEFPKIHQIITTNFQNAGEEIIELMTKNNIHLIVSIDGAVKETYEKIRIGASFDNLEKNLKKINNYIMKYKSKMSLQINFLVMKSNYKEIPDIVDFAYKYKFSIVVFLRCVTDNENLKITEEYEKDIENYIKQADIKAREYNIKIIDVFSEFNDAVCNGRETENKKTAADKGLFCHLPWYEMTVQEDNAVKPHCTCGYARLTNTDKYNNIYDIWNNEVMQEYRKQILKSDNGKCIDICRLMSSDYRKNFNK